MKKILFTIFGINIYGYGTMMAIGIIAALILLNYRRKQKGYDEDSILNMSIITILSGILGGKLLFVITEFKNIWNDPSILKDFGNGFVIYGAIIGGALAIIFYCKKKTWKTLKILDMVAPTVVLAQGFGRIGCFLAGCCYGAATKLSIGVKFKEDSLAPSGVYLHPTQLYSSAFDFLLAIFLLWYDKKERKDGRVFAMYMLIYSVGRFAIEFLRNDPRGKVGILSTSQFIAIIVVVGAITLYNIENIKNVILRGRKNN